MSKLKSHAYVSAQVSIEYLILVAVALGALLIVLPVTQKICASAIFAIDLKNAEIFINKLKSTAAYFELLGNGSSQELTAKVLTRWEIKLSDGKFNIKLISVDANQTKEFVLPLNTDSVIGPTIIEKDSQIKLTIRKENNKLLVKGN